MHTVLDSDYVAGVGGLGFVGIEPGRLYDMGITYRAVEDAISFTISAEFKPGENAAHFTTQRELPSGNSVFEHGILLVDNNWWDLKYKDAQHLIIPGGLHVNQETATSKELKGTYLIKIGSVTAIKMYGRGYLKFKDEKGRRHIMYTDVVSCDMMPVVTDPWD